MVGHNPLRTFAVVILLSFLLGFLCKYIIDNMSNIVNDDHMLGLAVLTIIFGIGYSALLSASYGNMVMVVAGVTHGIIAGLTPNILLAVLSGLSDKNAAAMFFGVFFIVPSSVFLGIIFGMLSKSQAIKLGMIGGIGLSVMVGMTVSVAGGVVVGVSWIYGILRLYLWFPELLWIFLLNLWPSKATTKLPLLPPQFDQLIILPLPFLPSFIAEAYQENQAAARQTIDYLITSTNQQKTAAKAISRIAVEELSRCQTARDIATIKEQLNWISDTQQSAGLGACFEISQDVAVALEASSFYRQAQQLDKVVKKIERQRNALATASAREATAFGSVLDSWQRILETARRTLREQAKNSDEILQVYLAGPALDPNKAGPLFKGRRDLFRQIETLTLSTQHPTLVMHGGRRSGKTSTLNYLPKWLPSDILPMLIDGQSLATTSTLSGFAEDFADQIIRSARKVHSLKLPVLESVTPSDDPFVTLRRWIDAVEEAVPDKTLLLCLDEFERLDEIVRATDSRAPP
ncbi:MAG: AAA family ATPase, partial [Candidatus Electrothrix sp. AR5]|nr:AAA family ATPase [Candidatus Electrothrix sp. AR5]